MRRPLVALLLALPVLATAAPAAAHPRVELEPMLPFDLTHSATDNVEHLGRFPEHAGTAGGTPSEDGQLYYLTDPRGVFIYDTTEPAAPTLLGSVAVYQGGTGAALAQEDPDTNGEVLLVDGATTPAGPARLHVVDVSDPTAPAVLSSVGVTDHTWTCVTGRDVSGRTNGCAYAYGRTGHIVDLTDPAAPVVLDHTWRQLVGYGDERRNSPYAHDLTEIRPGLVASAGSSLVLMDTSDPTAPVLLNRLDQDGRFSSLGYHSVEWAREGRDPFVVLGTEIAPSAAAPLSPTADNTAGSDCEGESSVIETWDAREVLTALERYEKKRDPEIVRAARFTRIDTFDASGRGLFLEGRSPGSQLYCAHWMELHPQFKRGGLMAVAYYDRGVRFVDVARDGTMSEVGWFTPAEGYTGSPQWVADDLVYLSDYRRGLEVVRLLDRPATRAVRDRPDAVAAGSAVLDDDLHGHLGAGLWGGGALLAGALVLVERAARRRTTRAA